MSSIEKMQNLNAQLQTGVTDIKSTVLGYKKDINSLEGRLTDIEIKNNRDMSVVAAGDSLNYKFSNQSIAILPTAGEMYVKSAAGKDAIKSNRANNAPSNMILKDISNAPGSAGSLTTGQRVQHIYKNPYPSLRVADIIGKMQTTDSAVEIMRQDVFTDNAGIQDGQLVDKNKSDISYTLTTFIVQTLAHWILSSKQILADVSLLRADIDNSLVAGLARKLDEQVLLGDGVGTNFLGLLVDPDVGEITTPTAQISNVDFIRKAITKLRQLEFTPSGIVMNPDDVEALDLTKNDEGDYLYIDDLHKGNEMPTIWKLNIAESTAIASGEFLIGDFANACTLHEREDLQILTSDSHEGIFIKNGLAILAEYRKAFSIAKPEAFVKGTFWTAP